jgi:hypothetical protein
MNYNYTIYDEAKKNFNLYYTPYQFLVVLSLKEIEDGCVGEEVQNNQNNLKILKKKILKFQTIKWN